MLRPRKAGGAREKKAHNRVRNAVVRRRAGLLPLGRGFLINPPFLPLNSPYHVGIFENLGIAFINPAECGVGKPILSADKLLIREPGMQPAMTKPRGNPVNDLPYHY